MKGIHRWPMDSPHKWPVMGKAFPCNDAIMDFTRFPPPQQLHRTRWRHDSTCKVHNFTLCTFFKFSGLSYYRYTSLDHILRHFVWLHRTPWRFAEVIFNTLLPLDPFWSPKGGCLYIKNENHCLLYILYDLWEFLKTSNVLLTHKCLSFQNIPHVFRS